MSKATVAEPPSNANEGPADHPPARQSKPPPDPRAATIKAPTNRLARQSPNDNHARAAMPVSHPDRRCLPIQIAALQPLGDNLRLEAAVAVARYRELDRAVVAEHRFAPMAVAAVSAPPARRVALLVPQIPPH